MLTRAKPTREVKLLPILFLILVFLVVSSCTTVKPYQRVYLNDSRMAPSQMEIEAFENSVFSYREGSLPGGSDKGKGGCGCN